MAKLKVETSSRGFYVGRCERLVIKRVTGFFTDYMKAHDVLTKMKEASQKKKRTRPKHPKHQLVTHGLPIGKYKYYCSICLQEHWLNERQSKCPTKDCNGNILILLFEVK